MKKSIFKFYILATALGALFITQSAYSMDYPMTPLNDETKPPSSMATLQFITEADDPSPKGKTIELQVFKEPSDIKTPLTLLTLSQSSKLCTLEFCPYKGVYIINEELHDPSPKGKTTKLQVLKEPSDIKTLLTLPQDEKRCILSFCPYKDVYLIN